MKSHFTFTKQQRNGIFLLLLIVISLQCIYFFFNFNSQTIEIDKQSFSKFEKEIDSLKQIQLEKNKPKIYPFNPNFITDFKGATLGMTTEEIDRLIAFRKQNKWINTSREFQQVTRISDSLLHILTPFFKFPNWISSNKTIKTPYNNKPKTFAEKQDLNTATAQHLQQINGIGEVFSNRIIKFRNTFIGGFIADIQLNDVYGLTPELIQKITAHFTVKTPREIKKINLNTATIDELVTIQHIDYDIANKIIEQRTLRDGVLSLNDLLKVKSFPVKKIDIIKLYLHLDKEN